MFNDLLARVFQRLRDDDHQFSDVHGGASCIGELDQAVEHVVDEISSRLRVVPNYARVLREPVAATLGYIDRAVETIPDAVECCRASFVEDPRANAFFASVHHMREVFSRSLDVRRLFDENPEVSECWALLCMHKEERSQLGLALVDDQVRKDVMQTAVNFSDHTLFSPGVDEATARCALKCCMFNGVLAHIQHTTADTRNRVGDLDSRLRAAHQRLRRLDGKSGQDDERQALTARIQELEQQLAGEDRRLTTVNDLLHFVADALAHPDSTLHTERHSMHLNRMAIKINAASKEPGYELQLSEISIASHQPRVGTLVRFPRGELLPKVDFIKEADLFLGI